jgi:pimeloyl-ACP methyl ester carboxylesterase
MARNRSMYYRDEGSGPVVVLLPGQTASSAHFTREIRQLRATHRVIAPDFVGTGMSQRVASFSSDFWVQAAADVLALMTHLGEEHYILVGCSGGGIVALILAAMRPELVHAIVLDSTPEWITPADLEHILAERRAHFAESREFWEKGHGDDWERVVSCDSDFLQALAAQGGLHLGKWLMKVECPALMVASTADELLPRAAEDAWRLACQIRQGRLYVTCEGGHPVAWTAPDEFDHVVGGFLAQIPLIGQVGGVGGPEAE